jgi:hypothetical protein
MSVGKSVFNKNKSKLSILPPSQQEIDNASNIVKQAQDIVDRTLFTSEALKKQLMPYIDLAQQEDPINEDDFLQMLAQIIYPNLESGNVEHDNLLNEMSEQFQLPSLSLGYLRDKKHYSASSVAEDKQNHKIFKVLQKACGSRSLKVRQKVGEEKQLREVLSPGKDVHKKDVELAAIFKMLCEAEILNGLAKQITTDFIVAVADVFSTKLVDMDNVARARHIQNFLAAIPALKDYQLNSPVILGYLRSPESVGQFLQQEKEKLTQKAAPVTPEKKEVLSSSGKGILAALGVSSKNKPKEDKEEAPSLAAAPLSTKAQLQALLEQLEAENTALVFHAFVEGSPKEDDPAESKSKSNSKKDNIAAAEAIKARLSAQVERIKQITAFIGKKDTYKESRKKVVECFAGLLEAVCNRVRNEVSLLKAKEIAVNSSLLDKALEVVTSQDKELSGRAKWLLDLTAEINKIYGSLEVSAAASESWKQISTSHDQLQALMQEIPSKYKEQPANNTVQSSSSSKVSPPGSSSPSKPRASSVPDTPSKNSFWPFNRTPKPPAAEKENSTELFSPATKTLDRRSSDGPSS